MIGIVVPSKICPEPISTTPLVGKFKQTFSKVPPPERSTKPLSRVTCARFDKKPSFDKVPKTTKSFSITTVFP